MMRLSEFLRGELRVGLQRMSENAQQTRESLGAAVQHMAEAEARADLSDEAAVELAGLVDTALTCADENSAAIVEIAGLVDELLTAGGE